MVAAIAFYVGLAREANGPVVELGVGNGRVAIPVPKATGQRVIGIDVSPAMLEQACTRAAQEGVELDLRAAVAGSRQGMTATRLSGRGIGSWWTAAPVDHRVERLNPPHVREGDRMVRSPPSTG